MPTTPPRRAGPIYDDAMRILADDDLEALLTVVGVLGPAEPLDTTLPASAIRADLVARTARGIAHVEFVKDPTPDLGLRMVDYRLRLRRRYGTAPIDQYVLVLREIGGVPNGLVDNALTCRWRVIRLAEQDPAALLLHPTTATLAALAANTPAGQAAMLVAAAELIAAHTAPERGRLLLGAAATLASIVLPRPIIKRSLKEAAMPVPVRDTPLGRELYEEGHHEGHRAGEHDATVRLTQLLLRRRFGDDARIPAIAAALARLPDEERLNRIADAGELGELDG